MIRKKGSGYVLKTRDGSRTLGTHATKQQAIKQEVAIEISKRRRGKKT